MRKPLTFGSALLAGFTLFTCGCQSGHIRTVHLTPDGTPATPAQLPAMAAADDAGRLAFYGQPGETLIYSAPEYPVWTPGLPVPPPALNGAAIQEFPNYNRWRK